MIIVKICFKRGKISGRVLFNNKNNSKPTNQMKVYSAKTNEGSRGASAFTLIEMIGVLAVIAILAAMLIPRVFEAINSARINNAAVSCETIKTAAADHYGKYGRFD